MQRPYTPDEVRQRLRFYVACADEGMSTKQAAAKLGVTTQAVSRFLGRHDPELRSVLASRSNTGGHRTVTRDEAVRRLREVIAAQEAGNSQGHAARRLGLHPSTLHEWLKDNAPFGAQDALDDYLDPDDDDVDHETDEEYV